MIKVVSIIFMLFLLCYSKDEQLEGNMENKYEIASMKVVEVDLKRERFAYGMRFKQFGNPLLPDCNQCSDLEWLLILERAVETGIAYSEEDTRNELEKIKAKYRKRFNREAPDLKWSNMRILDALKNAIKTGVPYPTKEEEVALREELKKIEAEYENRFKIPIPWWWLCSDEERLKRLEKSLETNMPYPDYSINRLEEPYDKERDFWIETDRLTAYNLGKALAKYEMWFKKQPPEWNCLNKEYLDRLHIALDTDVPYITEKEKDKLETALKIAYKKRFKTPITDFESSTAYIFYRQSTNALTPAYSISIARTATGAFAKYRRGEELFKAELNINEWLDLIRILHELRFYEWEKEYIYESDKINQLFNIYWGLAIFFLDKDKLTSHGKNLYPPDYRRFERTMENIEAKIRKRNIGIKSK